MAVRACGGCVAAGSGARSAAPPPPRTPGRPAVPRPVPRPWSLPRRSAGPWHPSGCLPARCGRRRPPAHQARPPPCLVAPAHCSLCSRLWSAVSVVGAGPDQVRWCSGRSRSMSSRPAHSVWKTTGRTAIGSPHAAAPSLQRFGPGGRFGHGGLQGGRAGVAGVAVAGRPPQVRRRHGTGRRQPPVGPAHRCTRCGHDLRGPPRPGPARVRDGGAVSEQAGAVGAAGEQLRRPRPGSPVTGVAPHQVHRPGRKPRHGRVAVRDHQLGAHRRAVRHVPAGCRRPPARTPAAPGHHRERSHRRLVLPPRRAGRLFPPLLHQLSVRAGEDRLHTGCRPRCLGRLPRKRL